MKKKIIQIKRNCKYDIIFNPESNMGNCVPDRKLVCQDLVNDDKKMETKCEDLTKSGSTSDGNIPQQKKNDKWLNPESTPSKIVKATKGSKKKHKRKKTQEKLSMVSETLSTPQDMLNEDEERIQKKRALILDDFLREGEVIEEQQYRSEIKRYNSRVQMDFNINNTRAGPISLPSITYHQTSILS